MSKIEDMDIELVNHLGQLGFSLKDIEKMTETEMAKHTFTKEDAKNEWDVMIASRGQY